MQDDKELDRLFLELYSLNCGWFKGKAYVGRDWAAANQTVIRQIRDRLRAMGREVPYSDAVIDQYKHNPAE